MAPNAERRPWRGGGAAVGSLAGEQSQLNTFPADTKTLLCSRERLAELFEVLERTLRRRAAEAARRRAEREVSP